MDWFGLTPAVLYAGLILVVPGYITVRIFGVRGPIAAALSPAISIGLVGILAIHCSNSHIWWLPSAFWQGVVVVWISALGVRVAWTLIRRGPRAFRGLLSPRRWSRARGVQGPNGRERSFVQRLVWAGTGMPQWLPTLIGVIVGGTMIIGAFTSAFVSPQYFSQTNDNMFHLNVVRNILNTGDASSFTVQQLTSGGQPPVFYPAGWHAFVALVASATSVAPIPAVNAATIAVFVVIWMLGIATLVQVLAGPRILPVVFASIAAAAMPAFPLRMFAWGGLYPNMLGIAMIPAAIATTLLAVRWWGTSATGGIFHRVPAHTAPSGGTANVVADHAQVVPQHRRGGRHRQTDSPVPTLSRNSYTVHQPRHYALSRRPAWRFAQALPLIAAQGIGMAFGHPNVAFAFGLFLVCVTGVRLGPWAVASWHVTRRTRLAWMTWAGLGAALGAGALVVMLWVWMAPAWTPTWTFSNDAATSWFQGLLDSQRGTPGSLAIAILGLFGIIATIQHQQWIILLYYALSLGLYVLVSSVGDVNVRRFFTGIFYQDPVRVGALLVIPSIMMVALGSVWILQIIWALLSRFSRERFARRQTLVVGMMIALAVGITAQLGVAAPYAALVARWYVVPSQEARLIDQDGYAMMTALPKYVPKSDVVIANPGNGSAFAYAMNGTKMMFVHNIQTNTLDEQVIAQHLGHRVWRNNVCRAIERTHAYYYLSMGAGKIWNTSRLQFPGLPRHGMNPKQAKAVITIGDDVLYRITWCNSAS